MSSKDLKKELDKALAEIERLKKENEKLKLQIEKPSFGVKESSEDVAGSVSIDRSSSNEDKIRLFRSLFKAREDIFAVRWTNRSGRSGYSPACYYEWDPAICKKPHGKCDNCKYIPLDDNIVRKHLSGNRSLEYIRF